MSETQMGLIPDPPPEVPPRRASLAASLIWSRSPFGLGLAPSVSNENYAPVGSGNRASASAARESLDPLGARAIGGVSALSADPSSRKFVTSCDSRSAALDNAPAAAAICCVLALCSSLDAAT